MKIKFSLLCLPFEKGMEFKMNNNENWNQLKFTNPEEHNSEQYIYIVHAIQTNEMVRAMQNLERIKLKGSDSIIDLTRNPNDIHKKKIISCSLIGKGSFNGQNFEALKTWANVGLILKVPIENILRSGTSDLGANFINPEQEIKKYKGKDKGDPFNLLMNSQTYNEVVVLGETDYGKVEVEGVFLSDYGRPSTPEERKTAGVLKYLTGKKLIEIPKKEIKLEDKPIHIEKFRGKLDKISFTRENREYYCNLYRGAGGLTWGLYATGDYGATFIKNSEDVDTFLKELENLPEEDKIKYAEILELIPSQYELCKRYFSREVSEDEIYKANSLLEKFDELVFQTSKIGQETQNAPITTKRTADSVKNKEIGKENTNDRKGEEVGDDN